MRNQPFHPFALLLAVTAHIGVGFTLGANMERGTAARRQEAPMFIVAELKVPDSASQSGESMPVGRTDELTNSPEPVLTGNETSSAEAADDFIGSSQMIVPTSNEDKPVLPVLPPLETRYFRPDELTEKPRLLKDIPPEKATALPDISPQPAIVELLIDERGNIDKVVIEDSLLSEQAKQFVIDSFANVKFHPGKLGDMPVRSQLRIEVTLKSAVPAAVSTVH